VNPLRRLAGQTAIYGLSSIVGRLINFLLVPLYTRVFLPGEYGVVTIMYTYVAVLLIVLTYGMETAYFRFSEQHPEQKNRVFSTTFLSVLFTSSLFILFFVIWRQSLAEVMRYPDNVEYIIWIGLIVAMDAIAAIPFARLRAENKALRFATIRLTSIAVNISLVLFFLLLCPWLMENSSETVRQYITYVYHPDIGVGYVFIANLIASAITLLLLLPAIRQVRTKPDPVLLRKMLIFALPLLLAGLAGWINEALDKLLLKFILPEEIAMSQVGIYGAVYKLSIMMTIFIQAFRFAAEPFFFAMAKQQDAKNTYAQVMNYFVMACLVIFLGITLFIDIFKHFIGAQYHEGLTVVPILLLANLFLGIYFNLSIWYKLTGKTYFGAWFSLVGAAITILLNLWWIPVAGYYGSAWATLICYMSLAILSYVFGQRHYKIPYQAARIFLMISFAVMIFLVSFLTSGLPVTMMYVAHLLLLGLFLFVIMISDSALRNALKRFEVRLRN